MALAAGTRLGAYEIVTLIGAGGMGEVYRSRDTRLGRDVAIKVLPEAFTGDRERVARFKREAQVLASLNHPHIAAIYGLEETPSGSALILELVDGPTLADRIARGPMTLDEALPIAKQIADALDAAHEHGIIHRDLKPANIKLTRDGTVKVLDFGLARLDTLATASSISQSLTITSPAMTMGGVILGTAAYMSPEQARGKVVDKRSDIWAFGCVLFEMLTGRKAFDGEDVSSLVIEILTKEPDWRLLPAPAVATYVVRRCLEKDPKRRLRDIGEARLALEGAHVPLSTAGDTRPARSRLAMVAGVIAAAAIASAGFFYARADTPRQPTLRYEIVGPDQQTVLAFALSPDGQQVALLTGRSVSANEHRRIWVRPLNALNARPIEGTDGALSMFWSPNSRSIAFFTGNLTTGELKKVDLAGGPPLKVCDAPGPSSGGWSVNGTILFTGVDGALYSVDDADGKPHPITKLDAARQEIAHRYPSFLPDGRHFLYTALSATTEQSAIYVGSLDAQPAKRLLTSSTNAAYTQGPEGEEFVMFMRGETLLAHLFDSDELSVIGDPFPVAERVSAPATVPMMWPQFSSSVNGVVTYQGPGLALKELVWFDRSGRRLGTVGEPADYSNPALSPDERLLAIARTDPKVRTRDIWVYELERPLGRRLTTHNADDTNPVWAPDSRRIAFASVRTGPRAVYVTDASGTREEQLLHRSKEPRSTEDWSPDGRFVLAGDSVIAVDEKREIQRLSGSRFSPDGKWLASQSDESGRREVFVQSLSALMAGQSSTKWQASTAGGSYPEWRRDGQELYFLTPDTELMAVDVKENGSTLPLGTPKVLFRAVVEATNRRTHYQPASNGQRFLVVQPVGGSSSPPITVVVNWPAEARGSTLR